MSREISKNPKENKITSRPVDPDTLRKIDAMRFSKGNISRSAFVEMLIIEKYEQLERDKEDREMKKAESGKNRVETESTGQPVNQ